MRQEKKQRNDKIVELAKKGVAVRQIAKIHEIHFTTVHKIIMRRRKAGEKSS